MNSVNNNNVKSVEEFINHMDRTVYGDILEDRKSIDVEIIINGVTVKIPMNADLYENLRYTLKEQLEL